MTVEILVWALDMPALARCSDCLAEWRRPKGRAGKAELEAFTLEHLDRHRPERLFPVEPFEPEARP
jgi:hypothetical protein